MDRKNVGIVGATGYVGEELLSILDNHERANISFCLLYTSPSPRDATLSRMPSSA